MAFRTIASRRLPSRHTFRALADLLHLGFRIFSPGSRRAFQLSVTVLIRYRTSLVFRVGSQFCRLRTSYPGNTIQDTRHSPSALPLRGYHTFAHFFPEIFKSSGWERHESCNSTSVPHYCGRSVCPAPLSIAFTHGMPIGLFSCGYLRCFTFPRIPSLSGHTEV